MKSSDVERRGQPLGVRRRRATGLPAIVISARTWPSPGVSISSARQATGQLAEHLAEPAHARLPSGRSARRGPRPGSPLRVRRAGGGRGEHRAAGPVEVAGEHVEHVDQPARGRAELLRASCRCGRRPPRSARGRELARDARGSSSASMPARRRRPRAGSRPASARTSSSPSTCSASGAGRDEALGEQHVAPAPEQQRVGARADEQVLVGLLGGARAARVDHDDLAAARADRRAAGRARRARSSGCRWRPAGWRRAQQVVGAVEVGHRDASAPVPNISAAGHLLGHLVDGARREDVAACPSALKQHAAVEQRRRGCARPGCRGRRRPRRGRARRGSARGGARSRRTPRPTSTGSNVAVGVRTQRRAQAVGVLVQLLQRRRPWGTGSRG